VNILPQGRKILFFLFCMMTFYSLHGQDIHFSQILNSPLSLNPALTGNFEGDWRVIGNYRDQWRSLNLPYRTLSASYDQQLYIKKHHLSVGLIILNDNSFNSFIKSNSLYLSGAYHRTINKNNLSGGLQIGFVQRRVDLTGVTFPESYSEVLGYFDPSASVSGIQVNDNMSYLDVNFGVNWSKKIRIFEPYAGLAVTHINRPNASFTGGHNILALRYNLNTSLKTHLSQNLFLKPIAVLSIQGNAKDFIFGSDAGLALQGNRYNIREVFGGVYFRNIVFDKTDAMIFSLGVQYSNLAIQMSYDFNVSSLNEYTNSRGAFEISFIFKSISTIIKTFTIPCERI
jgi:type IX secretion system PorP/SprF family membrane protein